MLVFADSAWHIFMVGVILIIGILLAIMQKRWLRVDPSLSILLYVWHTVFCIYYLLYSLSNVADSTRYYINSLTYEAGPDFGTRGIYYFTSYLSSGLGLSYGGVFLVNNIIGFIGLIAFASAIQEVTRFASRNSKLVFTLILFFPSVSFWSSAIGKESLTFLAAGLACWGILKARRRYPALMFAILLVLLVRPHIAAISLMSLSFCAVFLSRTSLTQKIFMSSILAPVAVFGLLLGLNYAGLGDANDIDDLGSFIERRQGYNLGGGSSIDIASMSLLMQIFSYLFRPFPFEVPGLFGLISGAENMLFLGLFLYSLRRAITNQSTLNAFPRYFL